MIHQSSSAAVAPVPSTSAGASAWALRDAVATTTRNLDELRIALHAGASALSGAAARRRGRTGTASVLPFPGTETRTGTSPTRHAEPKAAVRATVLVVADDADTRASTVLEMRRCGHRVMQAGTAREASYLLRELGADIDVLITDVEIPDFRLAGLEPATGARTSSIPGSRS